MRTFTSIRGVLLGSLLISAAVMLAGCSGEQTEGDSATPVTTETGHEGHNHAPGEGHQDLLAVIDTAGGLDWCVEHSVPESACTKCNPGLVAQFKESGDWCAGHGLPESHCRLCNPGISFPQEEVLRVRARELSESGVHVSLYFRSNAAICATDGALIQFASAETAERTGLTVQQVRAAEFAGKVEAPAEVVFDESKSTVVTSTVAGLVSRWLVSPGDPVGEGDVLAIVNAPAIAELRASLLSAHADYEIQRKELDRYTQLHERTLISASELERQAGLAEQARAKMVSARGVLTAAGLSAEDIADLLEHGAISNQFPLRAPAAGIVVQRLAQLGELHEAGRAFAMLADPSSMWIEASLTEEQLRRTSVGQTLTFSSDGTGLQRIGGEIIWVSRLLDPHTRTGTVRARVLDPDSRLQAGEFGRVEILEQEDTQVTLVPKDAVQWEGCCNVVFIKETIDRYRPRKVQLLDGEGGYYQVTSGVDPGEEVVVNGAFLLKTELKKTSIGAGCCGLEAAG